MKRREMAQSPDGLRVPHRVVFTRLVAEGALGEPKNEEGHSVFRNHVFLCSAPIFLFAQECAAWLRARALKRAHPGTGCASAFARFAPQIALVRAVRASARCGKGVHSSGPLAPIPSFV